MAGRGDIVHGGDVRNHAKQMGEAGGKFQGRYGSQDTHPPAGVEPRGAIMGDCGCARADTSDEDEF